MSKPQEAPKPSVDPAERVMKAWPFVVILSLAGFVTRMMYLDPQGPFGDMSKKSISSGSSDLERWGMTFEPTDADVMGAADIAQETNQSRELSSAIFEDKVFGFPAYCAVINTDQFGQTEHYDKNAPIVSTVHEILNRLGNQVYKDKIVLIQGKEVHVEKVENIVLYANLTKACAVLKPGSNKQLPLDD